jgi:hypothetical protein
MLSVLLQLELVLMSESVQVVEPLPRVLQPMPRHVIDFHGRIGGALVGLTCRHTCQVLDLFGDVCVDRLQCLEEGIGLRLDVLNAGLVFAELLEGLGGTRHHLAQLTLDGVQLLEPFVLHVISHHFSHNWIYRFNRWSLPVTHCPHKTQAVYH